MYNLDNTVMSPTKGFCISSDGYTYIANDSIRCIKIKELSYPCNYVIYVNEDIDIYSVSQELVSQRYFYELAQFIVNKLVEHIRYNITSNIYIKKIIEQYNSQGELNEG